MIEATALRLLGFGLLAMIGGSACFSPPNPPDVHYYGLQVTDVSPPGSSSAQSPQGGEPQPGVRIGTLRAASHLKDRMVWRDSGVEFGFSESHRWARQPLEYVGQALVHELFQERGLRRMEGVRAPRLDVLLLEFEELRDEGSQARIAIHVLVVDGEGNAIFERSVVAEEPIQAKDASSFAKAMSAALSKATTELGQGIASALVEHSR